jgi:hypothetical protein
MNPIEHAAKNKLYPQGAASGIRDLSATGFDLNIHKETAGGYKITVADAISAKWELYWTASGYGC